MIVVILYLREGIALGDGEDFARSSRLFVRCRTKLFVRETKADLLDDNGDDDNNDDDDCDSSRYLS